MNFHEVLDDNRFNNSSYDYIRNIIRKPLEIEVETIHGGDKDIIVINPLNYGTLDALLDVVAKYSEKDFANVSAIMNEGAMPAFGRAVRDFLLATKKKTKDIEGFLYSGLLEYNGEPMKIDEIRKNIYEINETGDSGEFVNCGQIVEEIVRYFCMSYCFFLNSRHTVREFIQQYVLTLQLITSAQQQENEMQFQTQREEAIIQMKEAIKNESQHSKKPKKDYKKTRSTTSE